MPIINSMQLISVREEQSTPGKLSNVTGQLSRRNLKLREQMFKQASRNSFEALEDSR